MAEGPDRVPSPAGRGLDRAKVGKGGVGMAWRIISPLSSREDIFLEGAYWLLLISEVRGDFDLVAVLAGVHSRPRAHVLGETRK